MQVLGLARSGDGSSKHNKTWKIIQSHSLLHCTKLAEDAASPGLTIIPRATDLSPKRRHVTWRPHQARCRKHGGTTVSRCLAMVVRRRFTCSGETMASRNRQLRDSGKTGRTTTVASIPLGTIYFRLASYGIRKDIAEAFHLLLPPIMCKPWRSEPSAERGEGMGAMVVSLGLFRANDPVFILFPGTCMNC